MKTFALLFLSLPLFPQADIKAVIQGRVIGDIYGQGTLNARVTLTGGGLDSPLVANTNDQGGFSFTVAPARYILNITKAGYFDPPPHDVDLGSSSNVDLGDVVLIQRRAISGTVRWRDGEPASGSRIQVLPVVAGKPAFRGVATAYNADERGSYRISNLRPGRYIVFASYGQTAGADSVRPRVALPVFYPGTDAAAAATRIDLRKSAEATDISFTMEEKTGVTVEGTLQTSTAAPLGTKILLGLMVEGLPAWFFAQASVLAGESFRFFGIPEGSYLLVTSSPELSRGFQPLQVGRRPISDLRVSMPEPAPVVVKVEIEDSTGQRTSPVPGISLKGQLDKLGMYGVSVMGAASVAQPTSTGELHATNVAPGETYSLDFRGVPADAYVESVKQGSREQHFGPFEFVANKVFVLLKKDGGTISGGILGENGPAPQAFVVLAPKNRKATNRFLTTTSGKDGSFKLSAIAPGEYDLFAFDRNDEDSYFEDDYLSQYSSHATPVKIDPGAGISLQPELIVVRGQ